MDVNLKITIGILFFVFITAIVYLFHKGIQKQSGNGSKTYIPKWFYLGLGAGLVLIIGPFQSWLQSVGYLIMILMPGFTIQFIRKEKKDPEIEKTNLNR